MSDDERKFPLTGEGCEAAISYLKEIGEWEYASTHGFSTDGYSITDTANYFWRKRSNAPSPVSD